MGRASRGLAIAALLGAGLAVWGWRSGDQAPIDVVAQARGRARDSARSRPGRDQRDPAPRGAGRAPRRAAGAAAARLSGVLVDLARADRGARAGGLSRDRPGSARLRSLGQAAAHRGLPRRAAPRRRPGAAGRAGSRARVDRGPRLRRLRRLGARDPAPGAPAQAGGDERRAPEGVRRRRRRAGPRRSTGSGPSSSCRCCPSWSAAAGTGSCWSGTWCRPAARAPSRSRR